MSSKQLISLRIAGVCGILSPVVAFTCIAVAIYYSPWFTWTGNWLSDLGGMAGETPLWAARGTASIIFNVGLIITGVMGLVFAYGLRKSPPLTTRLGRLGILFLLLDMAALCAIGIFPETTGFLHTLASLIFFFLVALSLLAIGTAVRISSEKMVGWLVTLLGVISLCSLLFFGIPHPWGSNAIAEMVPIVSIAAFALVFGSKLLRNGFESR